MRTIRVFATYSIPLVWGIVGLVVGCVFAYFSIAWIYMHIIMRPENITPADGLTCLILSLVSGIFIGSAALFSSAQNRWYTARHQG